MKWLALGSTASHFRFELLSKMMKEKGIAQDLACHEYPTTEFASQLLQALKNENKNLKCVRVSYPYGREILKPFTQLSRDVRRVQAADLILPTEQGWWLENTLAKGFNKCLAQMGNKLDISRPVFVAGSGLAASTAVDGLIKMGVKKIGFTGPNPEKFGSWLKHLQREYFDVQFEVTAPEKIIELHGTFGTLVNATPLVPGNQLVRELYFFNFLTSPALVVDFNLIPLESPLIAEARAIEIQTIDGFEIAASTDAVFLDLVFQVALDINSYRNQLQEIVRAIPFDPLPFKAVEES